MEAVGGGFKPADAPNFAYQKWDIVDERFPTCPPSFREWMGVDDEDEEEAWANRDEPWFSYPPDYYDNRDLMDSRPMVYITLPNGKHYMVLMFGTETVLAVKNKIEFWTGVPWKLIQLRLRDGTLLGDKDTLDAYVGDNDRVLLVFTFDWVMLRDLNLLLNAFLASRQ